MGRERTLGQLWGHRDFRRLWIGDTVSQFGAMISTLALPLVAVRELSASAFEVGLLSACSTAAFLVVGLPAGAWVDRMRHRNVLILNDVIRALALASLPLAAWLDTLSLGQLYGVAIVVGISTVFFDVAYQSYLPGLVAAEHLVEGNAKLQASQSVAQVAGPGAGGLLVQALTPVYAVAMDALSFLWSASWLARIQTRQAKPVRRPDRHLGREVAEGVRFVVTHPLLRAIASCTATYNLFFGVLQPMLLVLLARELDLAAGVIGLIFSVEAVGGLVGAVAARRIAAAIGQGPAIWLSIAVSAPLALIWPFVQRDWTLVLGALAGAATSLGAAVYNITQVSFRQAVCPPELLGRMNATIRFLVWGTIPIGGVVGGALAGGIGVRAAVAIGAVGPMLAVLPVYFSPLRGMRTLPSATSTAGPVSASAPAASIDTDSRPPGTSTDQTPGAP